MRWITAPMILLAVSLAGSAGPLSAAEPAAPSCSADAHRRGLDFWLGEWTVKSPGGNTGTSRVHAALGQCVVIEEWGNGSLEGENLFAFDAPRQVWRGFVANSAGGLHVLEGTVVDREARFDADASPGSNGAVRRRVRIVRLSPDRVEQVWEKSDDGGAHWTTEYRGEYSRR